MRSVRSKPSTGSPYRRVERVVAHGLTLFAFGRVAGNHPDDNYDHDRHEGLRVDRDPYTVGIAPGEGLVVRTGDVVMYIADPSMSTGSLITAVESVAGEQPGGAIVERLAALEFGKDSASVPPFGVLAPTADGVLLLLRGKVIAKVESADGVRELSGARALTCEVLPPSARRVTIGGRPGVVALKPSDLRAGVVPGGGFVLEPTASATQPSSRVSVAEAATILNPTVRAGPVAASPAAPPTESVPPVQRQATPSETSTLAPVAGYLETGEGAILPLDRAYVIGRDPLGDDTVRNAQASFIVVHDDQHVSRVHAFVTIDGGSVFVRDASTPGGTFIAGPGAATWTQIGTTQTELEPGWSLRVGARILTYRSTDPR